MIMPTDHNLADGKSLGIVGKTLLLSWEELGILQRQAQELIGQFTMTDAELKEHHGWELLSVQLDIMGYPYRIVKSWPMITKRQPLPLANGTLQDVFLYRLWRLLGDAAIAEKLLRCPECSKPFYRVHKMKYCGRQCAVTATQRAWRNSPEGREKRKKQSERRYKKKTQEKKGVSRAKKR